MNTLLLIGALLFLLAAAGDSVRSIASGDEYEQYAMLNRLTGPYWFAYVGAVLGKGLLPQLLWLKKLRRSLAATVLLMPFILVDCWLPLLYSLMPHDYLPASWWLMQPDLYALAAVSLACLLLYALLFAVARRLGLLADIKNKR